MRKTAVAFAFLCLAGAPALAQVYLPSNGGTAQGTTSSAPLYVAPGSNLLFPTNAVQTCGSMSAPVATLSSTVSVASLNCPGAGSYDVRIVPTSGAPLVGSITAADLTLAAAPSGRRLYKNGVGPLEISTETLTALNTGPLTYRVNGGDNLTLTLSNYTSGSAAVYITASYAASMVLVNGSIDTREEAALRQGKAFSASTGNRTVAAGSNIELMLTNPSNSGVRLVIPMMNRIFGCDNVSNALLPRYASLPNATTNLPSTAVTPTRRGGTSGTSAATVVADVLTTTPQTTPTTAFPIGLPFFGAYAVPQDRTLEPGNSLLVYITGVAVPTGLTSTSPTCSIIVSWFEESLN